MANPNPSTPVKVPSSAANYTPATLDPDLRSQINTVLWKDGHVAKIQERLLHSLNANSHNWPTLVQAHALNLLRSGEVTNFPALLRRVVDDVRQDNASAVFSSAGGAGGASSSNAAAATTTPIRGGGDAVNGNSKVNGDTATAGGASSGGPSLAIPPAVIAEALKVTRETLEAVCEIDENGAT